jgi:hypothetical protein
VIAIMLCGGCSHARAEHATPITLSVTVDDHWTFSSIAAKKAYREQHDAYEASSWFEQFLMSVTGQTPTPPPVISSHQPFTLALVQDGMTAELRVEQPGKLEGHLTIDTAFSVDIVARQSHAQQVVAHLDPPIAAHLVLVLAEGSVLVTSAP